MEVEISKDKISYRVFLPDQDPEIWRVYRQGQDRALSRFAVQGVSLPNDIPAYDANTLIACAFRAGSAEMLGGIRLEIKSHTHRLPLEEPMSKHAPGFSQKLESLFQTDYDIAELCGLWVSEKARGLSLGITLSRYMTDCARNLRIKWITGFQHKSAIKCSLENGYIVDSTFRDIPYPNDKYQSSIVWLYLGDKDKDTARETEISI